MGIFHWNLSEIKAKQKFVIKKLQTDISKEEREKLELSLVAYICLINTSGTIYTRFYNIMDRITKDKFSLYKDSPYVKMEQKLVLDEMPEFDVDYLQFLLSLANNIAQEVDIDESNFKTINLSDEDLIKISTSFYHQLGDLEITNLALKILNDPTSINITTTARDGYQEKSGINICDYYFGKSYCTITKNGNLFDAQALNHEVMHAIDFYMNPKLPSKNYYGFHEVSTYTIDYLFIDYLEEIGFDHDEIEKLKIQKLNYLSSLANLTLLQIIGQLIRKKGYKAKLNHNINDLNEVLTPQIKKQLLEIEAGIIAYGLAQQISVDKELGISNLKQFMRSNISKEQTPNFSFVGLDNETLIKLSQQYALNDMIKFKQNLGPSR